MTSVLIMVLIQDGDSVCAFDSDLSAQALLILSARCHLRFLVLYSNSDHAWAIVSRSREIPIAEIAIHRAQPQALRFVPAPYGYAVKTKKYGFTLSNSSLLVHPGASP